MIRKKARMDPQLEVRMRVISVFFYNSENELIQCADIKFTGYKRLSNGKMTTFFNNELDEQVDDHCQ